MLAKQFSNLENNEIKYEKTFKGHTQGIEKVQFLSNSSNKFVSCSHDNSIKIWDVNTAKLIDDFQNIHENGIWDFVINEINHSILTVSPDSRLIQTDLRSGQTINKIELDLEKGYSISHQNNQLLIGGQNGNLTFVDERNMKKMNEILFKDQIVYKVQALENNMWMVSTSLGKVHVIDKNMSEIFSQKISNKEIRTFATHGNNVYISNENHKIQQLQLDLDKQELQQTLQNEGHLDEIRCFYVDSQKKLLFSGCADSSIFVWNLDTLDFKNNLIGHKDLISSIDINSQKNLLISGSWDQNCHSFNIQDIKLN